MILLISDLHLEEERPDITRAFLRFLDTRARQAEALYILGDFFEAWIGDDAMTPTSTPSPVPCGRWLTAVRGCS